MMDEEELIAKGLIKLGANVVHALGLWLFFSLNMDVDDTEIDPEGFIKLLESFGYKIVPIEKERS